MLKTKNTSKSLRTLHLQVLENTKDNEEPHVNRRWTISQRRSDRAFLACSPRGVRLPWIIAEPTLHSTRHITVMELLLGLQMELGISRLVVRRPNGDRHKQHGYVWYTSPRARKGQRLRTSLPSIASDNKLDKYGITKMLLSKFQSPGPDSIQMAGKTHTRKNTFTTTMQIALAYLGSLGTT